MAHISIPLFALGRIWPLTSLTGRIFGSEKIIALIVISLFTLVVRLPEIGNPAPDFDEQLYYLAGERMWQGAVPFVDIWDRKPIGLFLIYAATQLLGPNGIIQYQLVAAAFAVGTACLIFLITRRITGFSGSICASALYVIYLRVLLAAVGQAETFFMIFCVGAMYLAIKSMETAKSTLVRNYGFFAMLLLGLGLQVKYTILFQCVFFGLFFLRRLSHLGVRHQLVFIYGAIFIIFGLVPTLLVTGFYVAIGQQEAFFFANFQSNFLRGELTGDIALYCILYSLIAILPIVALGIYQYFQHRNEKGQRFTLINLLVGWAISGIAAVFLTGSVYIYYFIPLVPALAILTGSFVGQERRRLAILPGLLIYTAFLSGYGAAFTKSRNDTAAINRITENLKQYTKVDCIYIYDGPTILYSTTNSCLPTTRPYPDHLSNFQEKDSMGLNQDAEVGRVLATRPAAIITANRPVVPKLSPGPQKLIKGAIDRNYHLLTQEKYDRRWIKIYLRNDLKRQISVERAF